MLARRSADLAATGADLCYSRGACPATVLPIGFLVHPYTIAPTWLWKFVEWQNHYPPDFCNLETVWENNPLPHVQDYTIVFVNGPPYPSGDLNCDGSVDIDDIVYFVMYVFAGGPPPKDPNGDGVPDC